MKRYYPSTRERITRAFNEGVKGACGNSPYSHLNSGAPLRRWFIRGILLARGIVSPWSWSPLPVVDLSTEFADMIAEVEAGPPKCLERAA